ncbi:DUF4386 domain-containing protein [Cellulomonas soli]|uniref:DUF4386 domain-containing protein n=1 Tax=Cellulomonas soli TaxID=931535 RepID=UPI003F85AE0D
MTHTPRQHARAAGALYLVTHVTSVVAVAAYGSGAVEAGVTLELALAVGCVGTGVLLWLLLREHGPARAATFALLRTVEASVIAAGSLPMLAASWVATGPGAVTDALDELHTAAFLVGQGLVIAVNTIVLGWLLLDSGRVPRALALLGLGGGALVLASDLGQLWGVVPMNGVLAGAAAAPVFAFELWFALYLIVVGLRPPQPSAVTEPSHALA